LPGKFSFGANPVKYNPRFMLNANSAYQISKTRLRSPFGTVSVPSVGLLSNNGFVSAVRGKKESMEHAES
jgi:hypothetical protein